jgi:predicted thioesterase
MKEKLEIGRTATVEWQIGEEHSAERFGNPGVPVFATPALVWLLDSLAHECLVPTLEPGQGTLGTRIDIKHLAATPIGMKVSGRAEVLEIDANRVMVGVEARDECDLIAQGTIERYISNSISRFLERTHSKRRRRRARRSKRG